ncbi:MAG: hypothetical protein AAF416_03450 [Pseudomonadota bacterium]
MNIVLCALLCALLAETALRLPFIGAARQVTHNGQRALKTVQAAKVSDHWKEKALGAYAKGTFLATMKLAGLIGVIVVLALAGSFALEPISEGFGAFLLAPEGLVVGLVAATVYILARQRLLRG